MEDEDFILINYDPQRNKSSRSLKSSTAAASSAIASSCCCTLCCDSICYRITTSYYCQVYMTPILLHWWWISGFGAAVCLALLSCWQLSNSQWAHDFMALGFFGLVFLHTVVNGIVDVLYRVNVVVNQERLKYCKKTLMSLAPWWILAVRKFIMVTLFLTALTSMFFCALQGFFNLRTFKNKWHLHFYLLSSIQIGKTCLIAYLLLTNICMYIYFATLIFNFFK